MSTTDPDGNPELANIGNALDGTLDISTEDVEEVPSEDEAIALETRQGPLPCGCCRASGRSSAS